MESEITLPRAMTVRARFFWVLAIFGVQLLYVPINRTVRGGMVLELPWDVYVPFWPVWALPYLLSLVWWTASFLWAAWKMEDRLFRALVVATLAVMLSSYAVYLLLPTYVERPVLQGEGWPVALTRLIYSHDRMNNAFPSGHTYTTTLILLFWWRWRPRWRWLWLSISVVVILSTLFTGQHNLLDPVGGMLWGWMGYRFGLWWVARRSGAG
jgi:membrane-associated phospholipid phosphatase